MVSACMQGRASHEGRYCSMGERAHQGSAVVIRGHQWPSGAISGHQWPSAVIRGHQGSSGAISGHQGPSGVIRGHQGPSVAIRGHQWPSVAIGGHQWPSAVIRGHQGPSVAIRGHQWSSGVIRDLFDGREWLRLGGERLAEQRYELLWVRVPVGKGGAVVSTCMRARREARARSKLGRHELVPN